MKSLKNWKSPYFAQKVLFLQKWLFHEKVSLIEVYKVFFTENELFWLP